MSQGWFTGAEGEERVPALDSPVAVALVPDPDPDRFAFSTDRSPEALRFRLRWRPTRWQRAAARVGRWLLDLGSRLVLWSEGDAWVLPE